MDDTVYSRQISMQDIGWQGQEKISKAHILIIGAGGVGCPLMLYLASSGIGKITIVDDDTVSLSNLHRQILFSREDIGKNKAIAASEFLTSRFPDIDVKVIPYCLDTPLAKKLVPDADLVIDGTDAFLSKYILSPIVLEHKKPFIIGAVAELSGYLAGFASPLSYRHIFPQPSTSAPRCETTGILPPVAGHIAMMMATEALKVIIGITPNILGNLLRYCHKKMAFSKMILPKENLPQFDDTSEVICLSGDLELYKDGYDFIDVRGKEEILTEPLPFSIINYPLQEFMKNPILPENIYKPVFICKSSRRAQMALMLYLLSVNRKISTLYFYR